MNYKFTCHIEESCCTALLLSLLEGVSRVGFVTVTEVKLSRPEGFAVSQKHDKQHFFFLLSYYCETKNKEKLMRE